MLGRKVILIVAALAGAAVAAPPPFAQMDEVPINSIRPEGWVRTWLATQASGLTGHIEAAGYPFNKPMWENPDPAKNEKDWSRYEQTAYWIDGGYRCGFLVGDQPLLSRTDGIIQYVLAHPDPDGYLGPVQFKKPTKDGDFHNFQWPQVVFFRALMAEYSATGEVKILDALKKHFLESGVGYTSVGRDTCNTEIIYWLYGKTGDKQLLDLANGMLEKFNKGHGAVNAPGLLSDNMPRSHGVSFAEMGKLDAIAFLYTGNKDSLAASVNGFKKVERDHGLVDGQYSAQEGLNERGSLASHETCTVADYTWSLGYLMMATGDSTYGDKIEKAIFNAGFGSVLGDFKGLQYFSCPNQVIADRQSSHTPMLIGNTRMEFGPRHDVQCCSGNVNRMFPDYACRMWMTEKDGTPVAALYGPSTYTAADTSISEDTSYPFDEKITFTVHSSTAAKLSLRIPAWCDSPALLVDGKTPANAPKAGTFYTATGLHDGAKLELTLSMKPRLTRWPEGGAAIEMGPLVFALKIADQREPDAKSPELITSAAFPQWAIHPTGPWNYALDVDEQSVGTAVKVERKAMGPPPWDAAIDSPITLSVPAKRVDGWDFWKPEQVTREGKRGETLKGPFTFTPPLPDPTWLAGHLSNKSEMITLVPYGWAKLRVSEFPSARPMFNQTLDEAFDGKSSVGWDVSGGMFLNLKDGNGAATANGESAAMKSSELLLDFSRPVVLTAKVKDINGKWAMNVLEPDGTSHAVAAASDVSGGVHVDLSQALNWHTPRRFRVQFTLAGKSSRATIEFLRAQYASGVIGASGLRQDANEPATPRPETN